MNGCDEMLEMRMDMDAYLVRLDGGIALGEASERTRVVMSVGVAISAVVVRQKWLRSWLLGWRGRRQVWPRV